MTQSALHPPIARSVQGGPPPSDAQGQTLGQHRTVARIAKDIGLFAAAPFVTLASLSLFPFIAMAMLARAWRHRKEPG